MTNIQKCFGARVKELRKRQGLTQEQLSEKINIGVRSLVKIETGKSFPSPETLEKLTAAFQTETSSLFQYEHLESKENIRTSIIKILDANPNKLPDIYKVIKALTI